MKASRAGTLVLVLIASLVVAAPAGAGGGCHAPEGAQTSYAKAEGKTAQVDVGKCEFGPTVLYVDPGTEVTWRFYDPVPHSVTGTFLAWGSTDVFSSGESVSHSFEEEGVYPYLCVLHPGMSAAVIVGDPSPDSVKAMAPPAKAEPPAVEPPAPDPAPAADATDSRSSASPILLVGALLAVAAGAAIFLARRRRSVPGEATPA